MKAVRTKIILSWLLLLVWGLLLYLHHDWIALCIFGLILVVRQSKPKLPQLSQRAGYILSFGLIAVLMLILIDAYHPSPPSVVVAGKILAMLILCPMALYVVYSDYRAFRIHGTSAWIHHDIAAAYDEG